MNYTVVPVERQHAKRYAIADENGEIVDDAQGYGYKTPQNAQKVIWYKFHGGKQKLNARKAAARAFWKTHPEARRAAVRMLEANFKELARGEYTLRDIADGLREELGLEVKEDYLKDLD